MRRRMNALANTKNRFQGEYKRVLCVCSAGLLRSPTAALVLCSAPYGYNTRSVGMSADYALVVFDEAVATWADEIVCMQRDQAMDIEYLVAKWGIRPLVICLDIDDNFAYRDPELMRLVAERYDAAIKSIDESEEDNGKV